MAVPTVQICPPRSRCDGTTQRSRYTDKTMRQYGIQNTVRISSGSFPRGYSLVEALVVITIASMLVVSVLLIYRRVRGDAAVIEEKLTDKQLAMQVLQRIAEDCDRLAAPGFDSQVMVQNKKDQGLFSARLMVTNKFYQSTNPPRQKVYEQVIWQTAYDAETDSLILYRSHSGLNVEDKILDESRAKDEKRTDFIPVTGGVTFFEVQAISNQKSATVWRQTKLPQGLCLGISFSRPENLPDGGVGIPEEKISYRTVAIDRTRLISYKFVSRVFDVNDFLPDDPNDSFLGSDDPGETGDPDGTEDPPSPLDMLPDL